VQYIESTKLVVQNEIDKLPFTRDLLHEKRKSIVELIKPRWFIVLVFPSPENPISNDFIFKLRI
jgi:hypothetical protein